MKLTELIEKRIDENVASYDLGTLESYKYLIEMIAIEHHNEQLRLYGVMQAKPEKVLNNYPYERQLKRIDQLNQTQISLKDQLKLLRPFANKLGLYDAADYIKD